uniref:Uncharacterized protein LOC111106520 isoform X1 n=1 Tax=Crassostrea virginica TaxID=6565 RepID=A0A8B8B0K6_CRAVI|nr:uncharacterized protein LOC111106520 isoform X1 [Crassostrea virginica]XP_022296948.1 uncharacterized protein LOC111106520 isoform X1 [Crassostrea virginica]
MMLSKLFLKNRELSVYHIAAAKGASSLLWSQHFDGYYLPCANTQHYIRPHMLAYFFNHSWPYERHVHTHEFLKSPFVSLFFKISIDFHTFIFPKNSAAWKCYQNIHKIGRMTLKRFICRENLETEICSFISKLYVTDWRLVYHLYTFRKIKIFVDHGWEHSFDFISFIQHVRTKCQARRTRYSYAQVAVYFKTKQKLYRTCNNITEFIESRSCLRAISFLNKQQKYINYQIQSILLMYFPLTYFIYHNFIVELPDLAQKNTIEIIQTMRAYGSAPFFHNHPLYDYWNVLNSPFSNPFRTMTHTILNSEVSEIISWMSEPNGSSIEIEEKERESLQSNALSLYENFTQSDYM